MLVARWRMSSPWLGTKVVCVDIVTLTIRINVFIITFSNGTFTSGTLTDLLRCVRSRSVRPLATAAATATPSDMERKSRATPDKAGPAVPDLRRHLEAIARVPRGHQGLRPHGAN